jgi:hypothetical protein
LFSAAVTTLHNNLLETTTCCCKGPLHEQWTSIKEEDHARRKPTTSCQKLDLHQNQIQTKQKQKSKSKQSKSNSVTWQTEKRTRQHRQTWTKATYYYYDTNIKNENQNRSKIAIISIGKSSTAKGDDEVKAKAEESKGRRKGSNQEIGTGRRKSSVRRNNLGWLFAKREEEKDIPSLHPSNQEDAPTTLRTMNVIISVVRKGGEKKGKQVPRVWTVGEKPKKEEAKREERQGTDRKKRQGL